MEESPSPPPPPPPASSAADSPDGAAAAKPSRKRGLREPRAVIAKRSREKKSAKMHQLEMEVTRLREQNRQLLIKSTKGMSQRTKEGELQRKATLVEMIQLVREDASEIDVKNKLQRYRERYSDFGEERATRVKFHLAQLQELLVPTQVSQVFFTLMEHWENGDASPQQPTYEGEQSVEEMWNSMKQTLQVTEKQQAQFLSLKKETLDQEKTMRECFNLMHELDKNFDSKSEGMGVKVDQLLKIISPKQSVLFLNWVENNKAVLHMIDEAEFRREV